jgi:hypothetical protein
LSGAAFKKGQGVRSSVLNFGFRISEFGFRIYQNTLTSSVIEGNCAITMKSYGRPSLMK